MEVDHINGDKSDSRPENLRLATRSQNRQNTERYSSNSTRRKGTWFDKSRQAFFCAIQCDGVREHFGPFKSVREASEVYNKEARNKFGEFYRGDL